VVLVVTQARKLRADDVSRKSLSVIERFVAVVTVKPVVTFRKFATKRQLAIVMFAAETVMVAAAAP
jgi:hypothetical protein